MSDALALKVIVIDSTGAGKTSLISAHLGQNVCKAHHSTLIAIVSQVDVALPGGQRVVLNVWDTCGQERY
jgi:GTPase SAR1 family protein